MRIDEDRISWGEVHLLVREQKAATAVVHDVALVNHHVAIRINFVMNVSTLSGTDGNIPNLKFEWPLETQFELSTHRDGPNAAMDVIHNEHVLVTTLNT